MQSTRAKPASRKVIPLIGVGLSLHGLAPRDLAPPDRACFDMRSEGLFLLYNAMISLISLHESCLIRAIFIVIKPDLRVSDHSLYSFHVEALYMGYQFESLDAC
jgi:hypothetical protein